jgi:hypothetical protein
LAPRNLAIPLDFCPKCRQQTCITIESRINKDNSRRRRKECSSCKYRYTTYEVSEHFYKSSNLNQRRVDAIITCLNLDSTTQTTHDLSHASCDNCVYMCSYGCSFDFPDAGGTFANECSMFQRKTV